MSLRHALLGLLVRKPASGYDLTKTFEGAIGRFAWQARHSQIYPELKRLTAEGLVEIVAEGARGRKTYATTAAGRAEFIGWIMREPEGGVRNEFTLRLFLISSLRPEQAKALLHEYAAEIEQQLTELRALLANVEPGWGTDPLDFGHLAADYGLRALESVRDWAQAALERIDAAEKVRSQTPQPVGGVALEDRRELEDR